MKDLKELDRAFGETPAGFHARMEWTLAACVEKAGPGKKRFFSLRVLVITAVLMLLCGAAMATVAARGGMDWWLGGRWGFVKEHEPEVYESALRNTQTGIPQYVTPSNLEVRALEAVWLEDRIYIATQFRCKNARYELHPDDNMDADGALGDERTVHFLWTEKGFDVPEKVMDDPSKQLLLLIEQHLRVGRADGPQLFGTWDIVRLEDGAIQMMQEFRLDGSMGQAFSDTITAAVEVFCGADGYLPLYLPFYTRTFADDAYGDYVDAGVLAFKVKVR